MSVSIAVALFRNQLHLDLKLTYTLVLIILTFLHISCLTFFIISQLAEGKDSTRKLGVTDRCLHPPIGSITALIYMFSLSS